MTPPNVRVFTPTTMQRLGLQNRVLRRLRDMGCKVLETTLDRRLTIQVEPANAAALRRLAACIVTQRTVQAAVISIEVDGCLVKWIEKMQ